MGADADPTELDELDPLPLGAAPAAEDLDLTAVLHALSDPIRLRIVAGLADGAEHACGSVQLPIVKSTKSHHLRVLRDAGIISSRVDGKRRMNSLRRADLERRFPGLLDAVLGAQAAAAVTGAQAAAAVTGAQAAAAVTGAQASVLPDARAIPADVSALPGARAS